ncbi:MAG: BrnT family toxin [Treponema sp.]|nr:BrnT family toxin [Treponema sp.]
MLGADVEWDDEKNEINKLEHEGLGFELAQLVFADQNRLERMDRSENNKFGEERWQTLGMVGKVLFVVFTEREERKRIISARLANKAERRSYHGNYQIDGKGWAKAN